MTALSPLRPLPAAAILLAAAALLAAIVRLAWLGDDAFVTLRCVENLVRGHGPVWNVGERVQVYTHPLWFWLLSLVRLVAGEPCLPTLWLSIALSFAAALWLALATGRAAAAVAVLVACLSSRAFGDYATSGLETPLLAALLVWLARLDQRAAVGSPPLAALALATGLLATTRLDLALLAGPVLLANSWGDRPWRRLPVLLLGLSPLLLWTAFAAFYYGSAVPVTAYAKALAPGIPTAELLAQGLRYVLHAWRHDPATMVVVTGGIAIGLARPALRGRALALGALLSCAYVIRVGGDFMAGRFFVPAFVAALALLARAAAAARPRAVIGGAALIAALAWLPGRPPFLQPPSHDLVRPVEEHGIQDERAFWCDRFGLWSPARDFPQFGRFSAALRRQGRERPIVLGAGTAGGIPFAAGELFHFLDPWLCDPLLMRLPVADPAHWRIGHFTRAVPDGYPEAIAFGDDRGMAPGLAAFHRDLRAALRRPLLAADRLPALVALLAGRHADALTAYANGEYRSPPRRELPLAALRAAVGPGEFWFDEPEIRLVGRGGWLVRCGEPAPRARLRLLATPLVVYRFQFLAGGQQVGQLDLPALLDPGLPPAGDDADLLGFLRRLLGVQPFAAALPEDLPPFDALLLDCSTEPWTLPAVAALSFDG